MKCCKIQMLLCFNWTGVTLLLISRAQVVRSVYNIKEFPQVRPKVLGPKPPNPNYDQILGAKFSKVHLSYHLFSISPAFGPRKVFALDHVSEQRFWQHVRGGVRSSISLVIILTLDGILDTDCPARPQQITFRQ